MVKVECDGCKAPYQIDEKRIPPNGLKMRCPKCGTNLLVQRPGGAAPIAADAADLPAAAKPRPPGPPPRPGAPPRPGGPPPVPPRRPPPPSAAVEMEADIEPEEEQPRGRGGFGEIDLQVDLPAPAGGVDDNAWGAPPPPAGRSIPPLRGSFGEVDLPAVPEASDLPAFHGGGHPGFPGPTPRGADLPAVPGWDLPATANPNRGADLPAVAGGFGEIDLPITAGPGAAALPQAAMRGRTMNFGDIPPAQQAGVQVIRGRTVQFGEIDLPNVPEMAGLPAAGGFGDIELPVVSGDSSLPMHAQNHGLPAPAYGGGLPMASGAGFPQPAYGGGLPQPVAGGGYPMAAGGHGLPMAVDGHGFPMPVDGNGLPMPVEGGGLPSPAAWSGPAPDFARGAFDDSDRANGGAQGGYGGADAFGAPIPDIDLGAPRQPVGSEVDIAGAGLANVDVPVRAPSQRKPAEDEAPAKRNKSRRILVAGVVVLAIGGGALALEPSIGPFGINFITDKISAGSNAQKYDALKKDAGEKLGLDTFASATAALDAATAARRDLPRYKPVAAYGAFITFERGLRFGKRNEDEALGKQLLAAAGDDPDDYRVLAVAAETALAGKLDRARQDAAAVLGRSPQNVDAAVVAGEIELADKAGDKGGKAALAAWKKATEIKKDARTLYGLARAQAAAGDPAAEATARAAIAASPDHAGARTLLATLLSDAPSKDAEALALLKKVTDPGPVATATGEREMINAFTALGRLHLLRSRASAAEQAFAGALKLDPQAVPALIGNAELFYRAGRYSEAQARYEAAARADATSVLAQVGQAKTMIALERSKEAKDLLKKLREGNADNPLVMLWLGRADLSLGNKKDAEASFVAAIKVGGNKPEVVEAYVSLAQLLSAVGRVEDANAKLAEASAKFPDFPALSRAKGEVALAQGRYQEAKDEFEAALKKEDDLGTRFKLGTALRRLRQFDEAAKTFDAIAAADKDYPGLALERGLLFQDTGKSEEALKMYSEALAKAPKDVDLKLRVGSTQVIAGDFKAAEKILLEVRKERPNSAEANHFLGRAMLMNGGNLQEAMRYLEQAVNIDPNRAEYHLYVGWASNEIGNNGKAMTSLNKALELDHELGDAYWQRGKTLQKQGATQDALRDLKTAIEKRSSRFEAYATMALCYQDQQSWGDAEASWKKAIAGNDQIADWHYRLGKLYATHNQASAAIPELEKAIELADKPDQSSGAWIYDAHLLLAEAAKTTNNKPLQIKHYRRFLELAPTDSAYIQQAIAALTALGETDIPKKQQ